MTQLIKAVIFHKRKKKKKKLIQMDEMEIEREI